MPIARKTIPQDFLDQMKSNLTKDESPVVEKPIAENTPEVQAAVKESSPVSVPPVAEKKDKYADVMNIRLSPGRRNEIKTFCSSCGVSITQYIESSFEYLAKEVAAGRIVISKGGISNISQ